MSQGIHSCDLLVVGSGAAGLAAAVIASGHGLDVLVCERAGLFGGASAISGGEVWVPRSRQAAASQGDSVANALSYLQHSVGADLDLARATTYVEQAGEALAYLEDHSHLRYELLPSVVDYYSALPGATTGLRTLGVVPFDGRRLGAHFDRLRRPLAVSELLGGMSIGREDLPHLSRAWRSPRSGTYVARLMLRYALDRARGYSRGTRLVMGNGLVGSLAATLFERGVPLWLGAQVVELLNEGRQITGAVVMKGGSRIRVQCRVAVIIATGGFSGSAEKRQRYFAHVRAGFEHRSPLPETNDGAGMDLAARHGAAIDETPSQPGAWTTFSELPDGRGTPDALCPHFGDRARPGIVAIDGTGRRFANEAVNYHDFQRELLRISSGQHAPTCHLVTTLRHIRRYGLGRVLPWPGRYRHLIRNGYLVMAGSIADLAARIGVPAAALEQTIAEYNIHARDGKDPAFGKGASLFERASGDPDHLPNACVAPLEPGPYCAIKLFPGDIGTTIGLRVDASQRVLDVQGVAIPHLYAIGNAASSLMGGVYPAAGITLGPAITAAYVAIRKLCEAAETRAPYAAPSSSMPPAA